MKLKPLFMIIRDLIKQDFGKDLPISGGDGNSIDTPIVIHRKAGNKYVAMEYFILQCLGEVRQIEWKLVQQALMEHHGRQIDQMKIETIQTTEHEVITKIENYYFDITECIDQDD